MEALQDAVDSIGLLQAIYFGDGEFAFRTIEDQEAFERLTRLCDSNSLDEEALKATPDSIQCLVRLVANGFHLELICDLSTKNVSNDKLLIPYASNDWLSREAHVTLAREIEQQPLDRTSLLDTIQHIQTIAEALAVNAQTTKPTEPERTGPVVFIRQWIWFPMIYTREKRGHIIDWAPSYHITGFLCPGKPGCLCLEGAEKQVGDFINDIKTVSWADIPASHRKMTLRWQEKTICDSLNDLTKLRRFTDMKQVTFQLHGNFGNHNNLKMLQTWMQERGCGEAFEHLFEFEA